MVGFKGKARGRLKTCFRLSDDLCFWFGDSFQSKTYFFRLPVDVNPTEATGNRTYGFFSIRIQYKWLSTHQKVV